MSLPMNAPSQAHLLVVEDNEETRLLLHHQLSEHFDLTMAKDVNEALDLADAHAYDVLLIDINLGGERTGIDLLQELHARGSFRPIPAIALTAYAMPGDRKRLLEAGFDDYLGKPYSRADLLKTIRGVLSASD